MKKNFNNQRVVSPYGVKKFNKKSKSESYNTGGTGYYNNNNNIILKRIDSDNIK